MNASRMLHLDAKAGFFKACSQLSDLNPACGLKERSVAFGGGLKLLRTL
jgi:hypothetical protein